MSWVRENLHWVLFVTFLFSTAVTVGVGVVAVLASLSALLAGGPLLGALASALEALALWVIPLLLLGTLDVVLFASALYLGIRQFSFRKLIPSINYRSDRLSRWAGNAEAKIPFLRPLGLSAKLEPTLEQRRERLKELYVEGEIGEEAFERKLTNLVDDEPAAPDVIDDTEIPTDGSSENPTDGSTEGGTDGSTEGATDDTTGTDPDVESGTDPTGPTDPDSLGDRRGRDTTADEVAGADANGTGGSVGDPERETVEIDVTGPRETEATGSGETDTGTEASDDERDPDDHDLEVE